MSGEKEKDVNWKGSNSEGRGEAQAGTEVAGE